MTEQETLEQETLEQETLEQETLVQVVPHNIACNNQYAMQYQDNTPSTPDDLESPTLSPQGGPRQRQSSNSSSSSASSPGPQSPQYEAHRRNPTPLAPQQQQQQQKLPRPSSINSTISQEYNTSQAPISRNGLQVPTSMPSDVAYSQQGIPSPASYSPVPGNSPQLNPSPHPSTQIQGHSPAGSINEPLLDHSHLKPGHKASLLSYSQTINQYRENAKKTNNPDIQCDFAVFMVEAAKPITDDDAARWEFLNEAERLLRQLANRGHAESQYYLANLYAQGLLNKKNGKNDFERAFPLFVQATKHHHPDAAYRAAKCYEDGLGCRKDSAKALQFYKKASTLNHPGAMYRLGVTELNGELGISKNPRAGVKWLKRAAEAATIEYPHALHELGLLHERGIDNEVFVDADYAVSLYAQAADLGYPPSAFRLGECYEYGKLGCPQDAALSIHYYTIAAGQGHREACFALTAWYLVGSPGVLPQSDMEAYLWAKRAAEKELPKAEYAVGYFTEVGIGAQKDPEASMEWYKKAAEHGDKRAIQRLEGKVPTRGKKGKKATKDDECVIS